MIKAATRERELNIKHGRANLVVLKSRLLSFILICEINLHVTPEPNSSFWRPGKRNFGLAESLSLVCVVPRLVTLVLITSGQVRRVHLTQWRGMEEGGSAGGC